MKTRSKRNSTILLSSLILAIVAAAAILTVNRDQSGQQGGSAAPEGFAYNADPSYYTEKYRPQYHLSPETKNMSDPNGMVYFEGEYHQFYQSSGQWGHAVSKDLLHWEHLPLAIVRDELGDAWSGSAVVDWQDTTGFFGGKPGLVAIFTSVKDGIQSQSLAYSRDKGRTWIKYEGNPILPNPNVKDFRDPKVFWHEPSGAWVMVVSVDKKVWFYRSPDLLHWEWSGEFGPGHGSHAAVWECPDLFELEVEGTGEKKWVLTVSIGNNTQTKGSKAQYFIGTFDGQTFKNDNPPYEKLWTDHGKDFYAAVSYSDIPAEDGRRIWLGWMSNWRYPFSLPTGTWKGNMSIPRELKLRNTGAGIRLVQEPVKELERLRGAARKLKKQTLTAGHHPLEGLKGTSFEMELTFTPQDNTKAFGVKLRKGTREETLLRYDTAKQELVLDRTRSGESSFEAGFAEQMAAPLPLKDGKIKLRLFVDDSTLEVFAGEGEAVMTAILFPNPVSSGLELFAEGGKVTLDKGVYYPMRSVWRNENPDGKAPLRILLSQNKLHLGEGKSQRLEADVLPYGAKQQVVWKISDAGVAEVIPDGDSAATVTGVKEGAAELQAMTADGTVMKSINLFVEK
ncbi:GH32 C-terminal domain-containing protein [Paenibacillus sp. N4]|uniref:GH32 C-terminal domain-containing protein n=1 Tax=Paenibacillus vietnamensis TaxID=2590547 RepID=UPI001CD0C8D6|nr:GH32 C-terminal domain-containing protein [Paenibacillus vietnamensis]MCA0757119.1 GH32 C-terminal domain-containing protein [Paenibacillus vietnamensis]